MPPYLSSAFRKTPAITEVLDELLEHSGVRHVELSGGSDFLPHTGAILQRYRKQGFHFLVHNYFPPPKEHFMLNIAAADEEERLRSVAFAKEALRLAAALETPYYALHPGFAKRFKMTMKDGQFETHSGDTSVSHEQVLERFEQSMSKLLPFATGLGVRLAIENLYPLEDGDTASVFCGIGDFEWALERFPDLGVLLDLAHANVAAARGIGEPDELATALFQRHRDRLTGIHISQNQGRKDAHDLITPESPAFRFLRSHDLSGLSLTLEVHGHERQDILRSYDLLKELTEPHDFTPA